MTIAPDEQPQDERCARLRSQRYEIVVAADPCRIEAHVEHILALLPAPLRVDDVRIGLVEAFGNAILHGALRVSYEARQRGDIEATLAAIDEAAARSGGATTIRVLVALEASSIEITLIDPGPGFDWRARGARAGLGLVILQEVFDAVRWNDEGNAVTLSLTPRD